MDSSSTGVRIYTLASEIDEILSFVGNKGNKQ